MLDEPSAGLAPMLVDQVFAKLAEDECVKNAYPGTAD